MTLSDPKHSNEHHSVGREVSKRERGNWPENSCKKSKTYHFIGS